MEPMREVVVYARALKAGDAIYSKAEDGKGVAKFHGWGCDYEEFEVGAGNFSIAIVERTDGTVESVPVDLIKFVADAEPADNK